MQRVIVFGSRRWPHIYYDYLRQRILKLPSPFASITIVHGDFPGPEGADFFVDEIARTLGMGVERHPANWRKFGRSAAPRRNHHMATLGADLAIGFRMPGKSDGTDNMADEAELRGIPVERHGWGWPPAAGFR